MKFLYELEPQYDSQKSFYKKANVYTDEKGSLLLMSYSTIVAEIQDPIVTEDGEQHLIIHGWYSQTTARHINEFLRQNGYPKMSKKEMEAYK